MWRPTVARGEVIGQEVQEAGQDGRRAGVWVNGRLDVTKFDPAAWAEMSCIVSMDFTKTSFPRVRKGDQTAKRPEGSGRGMGSAYCLAALNNFSGLESVGKKDHAWM